MVKLEKRLDDNLMYLRDALPEYSTFDVNMKPLPYQSCQEVPVNQVEGVHLLGCNLEKKPLQKTWGWGWGWRTFVCISPAHNSCFCFA